MRVSVRQVTMEGMVPGETVKKPFFLIRLPNMSITHWMPSPTDLFATDWHMDKKGLLSHEQ